MDNKLSESLHAEGLLRKESLAKIKYKNANPLFSIHWELKTLLYLGVMLLSTGLGLLVYKNIDTIGHQAILFFIATICVGCFVYCFKQKTPFSVYKVDAVNSFFDYVLLLGCLTFLSFIAYLQFEYTVFGENYGLASFIPMLVLFLVAYYFDHLGILSMGITNLAVWMGISVTPAQILRENDFSSETMIYTCLLLGVILLTAAFFSERYNFKKHFEFTYKNFGLHITFIALLSGYFHFEKFNWLWIIGLAPIAYFYYKEAYQNKSFYFLLISTLYAYIALSGLIIRSLYSIRVVDTISFGFMYFIGSGIGLVTILTNINKNFNKHDL